MEYIRTTIGVAFGSQKWRWLTCVIWLCLAVIASATVCAQRRPGSTDLRGSVSKTVTLSLSANASRPGVELNTFEIGGALRLCLSGSASESAIQVPILIRSNTPYTITASVESHNAALTQLQVLSVEATGKLVAGDAIAGVSVKGQFDKRLADSLAGEENLLALDSEVPFTVFTGPRISLGGGLASPHNALKVILLISVQARVLERGWTLDLKLQGSETPIDQVLLAPPAPMTKQSRESDTVCQEPPSDATRPRKAKG